jgi:hypothetical protein
VVGGAVGLHRETLFGQEEVDLEHAAGDLDARVHPRREASLGADVQEALLEVVTGEGAAGQPLDGLAQESHPAPVDGRLERRPQRTHVEQPQDLGLVEGPLDVAGVEQFGEVDERSGPPR